MYVDGILNLLLIVVNTNKFKSIYMETIMTWTLTISSESLKITNFSKHMSACHQKFHATVIVILRSEGQQTLKELAELYM
jgi:hypothetical protein